MRFEIPCYRIRVRAMDENMKAMANPVVIRAKTSSNPFFFPNNVVAPPAMAPDRPALRPDWSKTPAMMPIEKIMWRTRTTVCIL